MKPGIEVPEGQKPDPKDYEYYMHYFGCEWCGPFFMLGSGSDVLLAASWPEPQTLGSGGKANWSLACIHKMLL